MRFWPSTRCLFAWVQRMHGHSFRPLIPPALGLACLGLGFLNPGPTRLQAAWSAEPEWENGTGYRSTRLVVPDSGLPGFTRLPPETTAVAFTNQLSDAQLARNQILEIGSGVALGDVDGDGKVDLYGCALEGSNRLYQNLGDWRFKDITAEAGVGCEDQFSTGAVLADIDGDGDLDLLVNSLGGGTRLFLNQGNARFKESTLTGLSRHNGSTTLALADVDGDGRLDLYVANYKAKTVKDALADQKLEAGYVDGKFKISPEGLFDPLFLKSGSVSLFEKGEADVLYLNQGNGLFAPQSWTNGNFLDEENRPLQQAPKDWGLTATFRDLNGDRAPDLYVCNDFFYSPDRLWINDGSGRFRALPPLALRHTSMSSMAIDFADIDRDGRDDFIVTDMLAREHQRRHRQRGSLIQLQMDLPVLNPFYRPEYPRNMLFLNRGDGTFAEIAQFSGIEATDWTWSVLFLDVDLDGYEDVLITTGTVRDANDADLGKAKGSRMAGRFDSSLTKTRYPSWETPNQAYRNQHNLTFQDSGNTWGFNTIGMSHGMACADLDNDGDLDVVVNHLRQALGLYRNNASAPRIAVRLRGKSPNTQGIGARIRVEGGAVASQSQEVISGGRYLSGADPMRVFAAGSATNRLRIEVTWRSGRQSVVPSAQANRLYEVFEADAANETKPATPSASSTIQTATRSNPDGRELVWSEGVRLPFFTNISARLPQGHREEPFDDFERQPLLSRSLSRLGPGVSWYDVSGDGWEDLIVGNGRGGYLVLNVNDGRGGFKPMRPKNPATRDQTTILGWRRPTGLAGLLVGSSNYEDGLTNGGAVLQFDLATGALDESILATTNSVGPLALGVMGNKQILFVGGRVRSARYPEAASSQIYADLGGRWQLDAENTRRLQGIGLVSGAVWSDLEGAGEPALILACDWGPVRIYECVDGKLQDRTDARGLGQYLGWWNGVTTGDFDGDGRLDIVASNWGRNTKYQRHRNKPLRLYYGDFGEIGRLDSLEAYYDEALGKYVPFPHLDLLRQVLPGVASKFATFADYARAGIDEILGEAGKRSQFVEANWLETTLFLRRGDRFEARPLPAEAQWAPAFGASVGDFDGDGNEDLFLSQNFFGVDPETSRDDAGRGLWLRGDGQGGLTAVPGTASGVILYGEQRGCALGDYDQDGRVDLAVAQNNGTTGLFHNEGARPGLRVRLRGPAGNLDAIGATIRLQYPDRWGPVRPLQGGSGYWSQESLVQVMGKKGEPTHVHVRWPGGKTSTQSIPRGLSEVIISADGP